MRALLPVALAAAATFMIPGCASSGPPADATVHDFESMESLLGKEQDPFVIRIPKGTRVPVMVTLSTPFVHAEEGSPAFYAVFDRTVFWYPQTPDRISFDGENWQPSATGTRAGSRSVSASRTSSEHMGPSASP